MASTAFSYKTREDLRDRTGLSPRAFYRQSTTESWELIWEAGPYYERIARALEQANSYAIFVGWQIDSRLQLTVSRRETLKQFVVRLCAQKPDLHIYFLMWDYAYFYAFEREALQGWVWDKVHERVHFVFDNRHPYLGSHHEKLVVIDGEVAFLGGVDVCNDRWDTPGHLYFDPRRSQDHGEEHHNPYHDMSVQVRGEIAADLVEHVAERWRAVSTIPFPERPRLALSEGRGRHQVLISRTRAAVGFDRPLLTRETEFLIAEVIRSARQQLVIENQYYWSRRVNENLIELMRARAGHGLRIFLVVPSGYGGSTAFRMMGVYQTRLIQELREVAKQTGTRLVLGCPFSRSRSTGAEKPIYVHSKVIAVDDRYMAIGSANFNNRGLRLDTELTLTLVGDSEQSKARIRELSRALVAHWGPASYQQFYDLAVAPVQAEISPNLYLKPYDESWQAYLRSPYARIALILPVSRLFDPEGPLAYGFRARLAAAGPRRAKMILPLLVFGALLLSLGLGLWGLQAFGALLGPEWLPPPQSEVPLALFAAPIAYAATFSGSWIIPSVTIIGALCAGAQLGSRLAAVTVFSSILVAGVLGYAFSRLAPSFARELYSRSSPESAARGIGLRRLPAVLAVVINPRIGFQAKMAYLGIFSIPVRWTLLSLAMLAGLYAIIAFASGFWTELKDSWVCFAIYALVTVAVFIRRRRFAGGPGRHEK